MTEPEQPADPTSNDRTQEPTSGDMRRTQRGLAPRYLALGPEPTGAGLEPKTKRGIGAALRLMRSLPLGKATQMQGPILLPSLARTDPGWGPNNPAQGPKTLRGFRFVAGEPEPTATLPRTAAAASERPTRPEAHTGTLRGGPPPLAPYLRPRQPSAANTSHDDGFAETLRQSPSSVLREITLHVVSQPSPPPAREHSQTIIVAQQEPPIEFAHAEPEDAAAAHDPRGRNPQAEQLVWGMRTRRPGLADSDVDRLAGAFRWTAIASSLFDERRAPEIVMRARRDARWPLVLGAALVVALAFAAVYPAHVSVRVPAVIEDAAPPQLLAAPAAGTLRALNVGVGDEVHATQVLLTLQDAELDAQRAAGERELERASQRTRELDEGRAAHERKTQELRAQLDTAEQRLRVESGRVKKLNERRAALQGLEEQGTVVEKSIAVLSLEIASIEEGLRPLELEVSRAQLQLASFERERSEQLQSAATELDAARRTSASAQGLLERTQLRAPAAGRVEALLARVGDAVRPGQPLLKLGTLAPPARAVAYVGARDRADLRVGQRVRLELDRPQRTLEASVQSIAAHAEANGSHRIELMLRDSDPTLRATVHAGMRFTAKRGPTLLRWLAPLRTLIEL